MTGELCVEWHGAALVSSAQRKTVLHTFTLTLLFTLTGNLYVSNCELYCSCELSQENGCFTYFYTDFMLY